MMTSEERERVNDMEAALDQNRDERVRDNRERVRLREKYEALEKAAIAYLAARNGAQTYDEIATARAALDALLPPIDTTSVTADPGQRYYLISLSRSKSANAPLSFWGLDARGYVRNLGGAGKFTDREVAKYGGVDSLAVPHEVVEAVAVDKRVSGEHLAALKLKALALGSTS